jgi:hypothetical protein
MSELKATPGPWKIVTTEQEGIIPNFHIQIGEDQISVFPYKRIYSEDRTQSGLVFDQEKVANINLIAAAPDLYKALEHIQTYGWDFDICESALVKSRGEHE